MTDLFNQSVLEALEIIKAQAPVRTGALKASFELVEIENGYMIRTTIPYMEYTNEPWLFNSKWGKTLANPNQYWYDRAVALIAEIFAMKLGGVIDVIY